MTARLHAARALALLLLAAPAWGAQKEVPRAPAPAQEEKTVRADSTVRGRVVYADTGRPVRRARLMLLPVSSVFDADPAESHYGGQTPRMTTTDGRGEFVFKRLPAGTYVLHVGAPDLVSVARPGGGGLAYLLGAGDPSARGRALFELGEGATVEREVKVERGGAITGRVTYSDGEPATNATVALFWRDGERLVRLGTTELVDDRGRYRFEGLAEGEYAVAAAENNIWNDYKRKINQNVSTFFAAYHPSSPDPKGAAPVRVAAGAETEDVDITFGDNIHRVSGVVRWRRDGSAAAGAFVQLQRLDKTAPEAPPAFGFQRDGMSAARPYAPGAARVYAPSDNLMGNADAEGRWSFENVPDGTYNVTVMATTPAPQTDNTTVRTSGALLVVGSNIVRAEREVSVGGGDVSGVELHLAEGGRVSGRVTVEGRGDALNFNVLVAARSVTGGRIEAFPRPSAPDGAFLIEGLTEGQVVFDAYLMTKENVYLKSITGPDGTDLMRTPVSVNEETRLEGVRVVLAADGATLAGRVNAREGGTAAGASVYLVPADPSLWDASGRLQSTFADFGGGFTLNCPPGDYLLFVAALSEPAYASPAALVAAHPAPSLRLTLAPNERKEVEVAAP